MGKIKFYNIGEYLGNYSKNALQNLRRGMIALGNNKYNIAKLIHSIPKELEEKLWSYRKEDIDSLSRYSDLFGKQSSLEIADGSTKYIVKFHYGEEASDQICKVTIRALTVDAEGKEKDFQLLGLSNQNNNDKLVDYEHRINGKLECSSLLEYDSDKRVARAKDTYADKSTSTSIDFPLCKLDDSVNKRIKQAEEITL